MSTITYTGRLMVTSCWCGIAVAIPDDLYNFARRKGTSVWCPLGHTFVYGDAENDRLRKELERAEARQVARQATIDRLRAEVDHVTKQKQGYQGQLARTKKRVAKGVCPCCNRQFPDLARHVATKHPNYAPTVGGEGGGADDNG